MEQKEAQERLAQAAAIAAAPRPMELGGRTLLVSAPTDADVMAITLQASRSSRTPLARLTLDPAFHALGAPLQTVAVREAAHAQVGGAPGLDAQEMLGALTAPDVLSFAIWVLARKNHPELRREDIRSLVTDANAVEVFVLFNEASGMADLGNSAGPPGSAAGQNGTASSSTGT